MPIIPQRVRASCHSLGIVMRRQVLTLALVLGASPALAQQTIGGCALFPIDNVWNTPVDALPVHPNSANFVASIGTGTPLHPDFGTFWPDPDSPIGIPFAVVPNGQAMVPIDFDLYGWPEESDPGPYPFPPGAPIEGGPASDGDRHVLVLRQGSCLLYELYYSWPHGTGPEDGPLCNEPGGWCGASGAVYDLASNALRPDGWTSADAAGLPILPGLVSFDEVAGGEIRHALRFTVDLTQNAHVWPARHDASDDSNPNRPPMGLRFRLKAAVPLTGLAPEVRVILSALKKYGMIVADNGSDWYVSGQHHPDWDDDALVTGFGTIHGSDFEAVDVSSLLIDSDSGATPHLFSDGFEGGGTGHWSSTSP